MVKRRKQRKWFRQALWSFLGIGVVWYFLYHMIEGDRGWFALLRVQGEIKAAKSTLSRLQKEREEIAHRAGLLRDQSLDPDLLDEQSREKLNFSKPNEIVILTPEAPSPSSSKAGGRP